MNHKKLPIKQAIKAYYSARSLSDAQLQSLQRLQQSASQQQTETKPQRTSGFKWLTSIAASFLILAVFVTYLQTPAIITAAYADIKTDADTKNGLPSSMSQWMINNRIEHVPQKYKVEMSKFCQLQQHQTTHLRIAGATQGKMHLFFHHGDKPIHWLNRSGTDEQMNWKLVQVREDLSLIVMYTHDMREEAVRDILGEMLPELHA